MEDYVTVSQLAQVLVQVLGRKVHYLAGHSDEIMIVFEDGRPISVIVESDGTTREYPKGSANVGEN